MGDDSPSIEHTVSYFITVRTDGCRSVFDDHVHGLYEDLARELRSKAASPGRQLKGTHRGHLLIGEVHNDLPAVSRHHE